MCVPMHQFQQLINTLLDYVNQSDVATIVLKDFNDDILCPSGSRVESLMSSHGYTQLVKTATTDRATLVDHVHFN